MFCPVSCLLTGLVGKHQVSFMGLNCYLNITRIGLQSKCTEQCSEEVDMSFYYTTAHLYDTNHDNLTQ